MSNVAGLSPAVDRLLDESSSGSSNPVSPARQLLSLRVSPDRTKYRDLSVTCPTCESEVPAVNLGGEDPILARKHCTQAALPSCSRHEAAPNMFDWRDPPG